MASISMATISLRGYCSCNCSSIHRTAASVNWRLSLSSNQKGRSILQHVSKPLSAVGSGLEASITDPKDNAMNFKNAKIVVESKEEDKIQLRVDLSGDETQKVFDKVLTDLGKSAPPIPGFRRQKGVKLAGPLSFTTRVPRDFLLQILGEERVTNFVIQEIVSSSLADYENLNVKDNKVNTIQKAEELKKLFTPGTAFGFTAVLELEETKTEPSS
ncbi:hypothetical protein JCGZ_05725 [Jatropha curcas]|uniref:peptidylprolyl isomerase n=1 Tax=Jatropha curcas TaxID=180498 RepID=A0A067LAN8_JATCU|nr:hypothetical protein JCGZ_05725 [Jatropha curcas]